jgi:hypothetical protein
VGRIANWASQQNLAAHNFDHMAADAHIGYFAI